jgi:hypothetical protein
MKPWIVLPLAVAVACLGGCTTVGSVNPSGELRSQSAVVLPPQTPNLVVSKETLLGTAGTAVTGVFYSTVGATLDASMVTAVAGALLYLVYDPLAPNWTINERELDAATYRLSLRAKNFRTGGDGEAMRIVKRRAAQLQREKGYTDYELLDYTEGIESAIPFSYRVSEGTIQLVNR